MKEFTFESANKLQWTNPHIDFVVASRLFLSSYNTRPESETFLNQKFQFEYDCLEQAPSIPELSYSLRKTLRISDFGASRDITNKSMALFLAACLPAAIIVAIQGYTNPVFKKYVESQPVINAFEGILEYRHRYFIEYMRKPLGGVLLTTSLEALTRTSNLFMNNPV